MKAVLVFEVNEDVFKELEKTSDLDIRFKYHDTMYVPKEKRIINYSLNPMPEKKDYPGFSAQGYSEYEAQYCDGYNDCIDEMLGGNRNGK